MSLRPRAGGPPDLGCWLCSLCMALGEKTIPATVQNFVEIPFPQLRKRIEMNVESWIIFGSFDN